MTQQRQPTATRSAADRLNMESSRLLCDDGHSASCPAGVGKGQDSRGVDGWFAASLDAALPMRQGGRGGGPLCLMNTTTEAKKLGFVSLHFSRELNASTLCVLESSFASLLMALPPNSA